MGVKIFGAAALVVAFCTPSLGEDCRSAPQEPDLNVRELADVLARTAQDQWPAIGMYSDEYLVDVGRWLRSAAGRANLGDEAETIIQEEIIQKLQSGESVNWDFVVENVGFGARETIVSLYNEGDSLTPGQVENAIDDARKGINDFNKDAATAVFEIVEALPYCKPGAAAPAPQA